MITFLFVGVLAILGFLSSPVRMALLAQGIVTESRLVSQRIFVSRAVSVSGPH